MTRRGRGSLALVASCVLAPSAWAMVPPAPASFPAPVQAATQAPVLSDSAIDARTTAIASQLRCPVCQGLSIQDSPSELSQQMRALVKEQVTAGKSDDEIRSYFVSKYGEWILLSPRPRGFNLLAYVLPFALLVAGGIIIVLSVRRWAAPPDAGPAGGPASEATAPAPGHAE